MFKLLSSHFRTNTNINFFKVLPFETKDGYHLENLSNRYLKKESSLWLVHKLQTPFQLVMAIH
ncbi:MAG: hypothetical protein N4J56_003300 [Chroococcidiopsis sp. SAG 2025]|nr:hypothetical protein [Chroococcidiopsis sp. SAG 2025]